MDSWTLEDLQQDIKKENKTNYLIDSSKMIYSKMGSFKMDYSKMGSD